MYSYNKVNLLAMKWLYSSFTIANEMCSPTNQIVSRPNITVGLGLRSLSGSSNVATNKLEYSKNKIHIGEGEPTKAYRFKDGMWYYCAFSSLRPDFVGFPQILPRRFRKVNFFKMKMRVLPKLTFNLNPKIPFKEPVIDGKANPFNSGDEVNKLAPIDMAKPVLDFQNSEELKTANEDVKRLFSLEMGRRKDIVDCHINELVQKIERHKLDSTSLEVKIARMTVKIRANQELFRDHPFTKKLKISILEMTQKRNKKLRILRMQDMRRFQWLIQVLGVTYRPSVLGATITKPTRISELKRFTEEYCENIRTKRMNAFHEQLKVQQKEFLHEKEATLEWIREQEKKFGLEVVCESAMSFLQQGRHLSCRVVITGLGAVCPLGVGVAHIWNNLINCESGTVSTTSDARYDSIPCRVAAFIPKGKEPGHLNLEKHFEKGKNRGMSLGTQLALVACEEALTNSKWKPTNNQDLEDTGVAIGMGMSDLEEIVNTGMVLNNDGYNRVSPFFVPKILTNMAAGHISIKYGFKGPNHSVSTACTTGAHAIGDAFNFIRNGYASLMVCGGTEAVICPLSLAAFSRMRALCTTFNSEPSKASRPFDEKRNGFVMGEGAGILILESLEHAKERDATIYGEILGYGLSSDAFHITAPKDDGDGAYRCMLSALKRANIEPTDVGYINAHATSTPLGDAAEVQAIKKLFQEHSKTLSVSSTKGATGHLLGAAGAVEAIFTVMACHTGIIPPTINLEKPSADLDLNFVPNGAQTFPGNITRRVALTNSFGFGGTNACVVISSEDVHVF